MTFETFEHKADIGIRGKGKNIEEAFQEAAKAMFSIEANIKKIRSSKKIRINVSAPNVEELLAEFLNKLLAESSIKNMLFSEFKIKVKNNSLEGYAFGEKMKKEHELKTEIKAATYSQLKVYQEKSSWIAQCIVDV